MSSMREEVSGRVGAASATMAGDGASGRAAGACAAAVVGAGDAARAGSSNSPLQLTSPPSWRIASPCGVIVPRTWPTRSSGPAVTPTVKLPSLERGRRVDKGPSFTCIWSPLADISADRRSVPPQPLVQAIVPFHDPSTAAAVPAASASSTARAQAAAVRSVPGVMSALHRKQAALVRRSAARWAGVLEADYSGVWRRSNVSWLTERRGLNGRDFNRLRQGSSHRGNRAAGRT